MATFPGYHREPGEMPRSGCGCLIIGALGGLLVAIVFFGFAFYVTNLMEAGWGKH